MGLFAALFKGGEGKPERDRADLEHRISRKRSSARKKETVLWDKKGKLESKLKDLLQYDLRAVYSMIRSGKAEDTGKAILEDKNVVSKLYGLERIFEKIKRTCKKIIRLESREEKLGMDESADLSLQNRLGMNVKRDEAIVAELLELYENKLSLEKGLYRVEVAIDSIAKSIQQEEDHEKAQDMKEKLEDLDKKKDSLLKDIEQIEKDIRDFQDKEGDLAA